jgi:hypothetical protein
MTLTVGHDPHRHLPAPLHAPAEEAKGSRAGDRRGTSEKRLKLLRAESAERRDGDPEMRARLLCAMLGRARPDDRWALSAEIN